MGSFGLTFSPALAHGALDTGSTGGGTALLIIIAVAVAVVLVRAGWNRWRRRKPEPDDKIA